MSTVPLSDRILKSFLPIFFDLLYHQFAWAYDFVAAIVSLGMWKDWVISVTSDLDGPRVLEIGHGPGHLQFELTNNGVIILGVDQSAAMSRLAYRRLRKYGYVPLLARCQAQFLPYKSHTFNQLVSTFPSEYIVDPLTLSEAFRVLVPGGKFVILPIAWIKGRSLIDRFSAWLFRFTGQSPDWDDRFLLPLLRVGFNVEVEKRTLGSTELLVIHAQTSEGK